MPTKKPEKPPARARRAPAKSTSGSKTKNKSDALRPGQKVSWKSSGATIRGTVKRQLTGPMKIKSHQVKATPENPEYLVQSDKTGALAAHKPEALHPRA